MHIREISDLLRCDVFAGDGQENAVVQFGCASDLMSDVLAFSRSGAVLLTGLKNIQTIHTALIADIKVVVLVRGKKPDLDMVELARKNRLPLLGTPFSMYEACGLLYAKGLVSTMEPVSNHTAGTGA